MSKDERSKLDGKTRQCIFIGYGLDEFCYRLYDPIGKKLVRSRDIIFMENQTIEDIKKEEKVESSSFDGIVHHDGVPHTSLCMMLLVLMNLATGYMIQFKRNL